MLNNKVLFKFKFFFKMELKNFINKIQKEAKALVGKETKSKSFYSQNDFGNEAVALEAFQISKEKLLDINKWSELPGLTSGFYLYDKYSSPKNRPEAGDYIKIILPGPALPENWVRIHRVFVEENIAYFSVHPDKDPAEKDKEEIDHFFIPEADNNFVVELEDNKINAYVIGRREGINNRGKEAGDRAILNTLIAEGGWAFFQDVQWQTLTDYLVHLIEIEED